MAEFLLWTAVLFLGAHLLTDARRMVQVVRRNHSTKNFNGAPCPGCRNDIDDGIKEAWWEAITMAALIGHLAFDIFGG